MFQLLICLMVLGVAVVGCGGGGEASKPEPVAKPAEPAAAPVDPLAREKEWGRCLARLAKASYNRGGLIYENLLVSARQFPEKTQAGLREVIREKSEGWDYALLLLKEIPAKEDQELRDLVVKVVRQDGYSWGRNDAIALAGHLRLTDIAGEVLDYLKTLKPNDTEGFPAARALLATAKPNGLRELVLSQLTQNVAPSGETLGAAAELLGTVDPGEAQKLLPERLMKEDGVEAEYIGAARGLGIAGGEPGKRALLDFVKRFEERLDTHKNMYVRKVGNAFYVAVAELSRFEGEEVWEYLLLYDSGYPYQLIAEQKRVESAITKIPSTYREKVARAWAFAPWIHNKKYRPKGSENKRRFFGERVLAAQLNSELKALLLKELAEYGDDPKYDGNVSEVLLRLSEFAKAGDQEIKTLLRQWARPGKADTFTSRMAARQELQRTRDAVLLEYLVGDNIWENASDWNRAREFDAVVVPGLSDAFLKFPHKPDSYGNVACDVVYKFLAAESRADVLAFLRQEIEKHLDSPGKTPAAHYLLALHSWKGTEVDDFYRSVIARYEKQGVEYTRGYATNEVQAKREVLAAAYVALSTRGDPNAFRKVYAMKPEVYNETWKGVPVEYAAFLKEDPGPVTIHWPTADALLPK